jgi:hypothetical protein
VPSEGNCFDSVQGHLFLKLFKKLLGEIEEAWSDKGGSWIGGQEQERKARGK